MAVKGKGKEVTGKAPMPSASASSSGKRLASAGSDLHRKKRRRSGVLQFFDESAVDAGCDDAESDEDDDDNVDRGITPLFSLSRFRVLPPDFFSNACSKGYRI